MPSTPATRLLRTSFCTRGYPATRWPRHKLTCPFAANNNLSPNPQLLLHRSWGAVSSQSIRSRRLLSERDRPAVQRGHSSNHRPGGPATARSQESRGSKCFCFERERAWRWGRGRAHASTVTATVARVVGARSRSVSSALSGSARPRGDSLPQDGPPRNRLFSCLNRLNFLSF
jgi:hypothetical protein